MPEIAEVARVAAMLRTYIANKPILKVHASDDPIVYGKVGTSATEFEKAVTGKTVVDVKTQGKYFWFEMSTPPHILMHFGMTGWIHMNNQETAYWEMKDDDKKVWPPRFEKWRISFEGDTEASFVDARRLARIRLIDVAASEMRKTTPLKENGPDPHQDKDVLTKKWLRSKLRSKKVPVKALLLDQANISGIGNWVGDEVMFKARLHPEQISNTFSDEEIDRLHDAIMHVVDTAIENNADKDKFPAEWLFKYRKAGKLPSGEKIALLKVGGRTSAVVPKLQIKTGSVTSGITVKDEIGGDENIGLETPKSRKRKASTTEDDSKPSKKENIKPKARSKRK